MPLTKSARKKLKQDKERAQKNRQMKDLMKESVKKTKKAPTPESIVMTVRVIDKAAKNHIIHKNKAARMKSTLTKLITGMQSASPEPKKSAKKTTKRQLKSTPHSAQ